MVCDGKLRAAGPTLISLAGLLLWACGSGSASGGGTDYKIATVPAGGQVANLTSAYGTLSGKVNQDGTACLWIGEGADRQALIWPTGYSARGVPVSVFDKAGTLAAVAGQKVTLIGGPAAGGTGAQVLGCAGFTAAWVVEAVPR